MKHKKLFLLVASVMLVGLGSSWLWLPQIMADEHPSVPIEVNPQSTTFQDVLNQLFGVPNMPGLLNGTQPFEFKAENLMLSTQQAQDFFNSSTSAGMNLAALASAVEKLPGTEVKLQGLVNGHVPFEVKIEAGEIKLEGVPVSSQTQLNALVDQLRAIPGIHEVKAEVLVNGQPTEVKIENRAGEVKIEDETGEIEKEHKAEGNEIKAQSATFQGVLNQLFGAPNMTGLLTGTQPFEFKAENLMLTTQQAQDFFNSSTSAGMNLAALTSAVEKLPGTEVKLQGLVNGSTPFEVKIEAGEIKLEGVPVSSQTQLNALVDQLRAIPGIHEVKAEALLNGQPVEVKFETQADMAKIENEAGKTEKAEKANRSMKIDRPQKVERQQRADHPEKIERIEKPNKIERPEPVERIDRPSHD